MTKMDKTMFIELKKRLGDEGAGFFLAVLLDALDNFTDGVDSRNIRTVEIKFNDFFSHRVDIDEEIKKKKQRLEQQGVK